MKQCALKKMIVLFAMLHGSHDLGIKQRLKGIARAFCLAAGGASRRRAAVSME
jgi:hypothetical protein